LSDNSWVGEDALSAVARKGEKESLTGGEADDETAASGRTEHTTASRELSDKP
jgi:hypothetical protein